MFKLNKSFSSQLKLKRHSLQQQNSIQLTRGQRHVITPGSSGRAGGRCGAVGCSRAVIGCLWSRDPPPECSSGSCGTGPCSGGRTRSSAWLASRSWRLSSEEEPSWRSWTARLFLWGSFGWDAWNFKVLKLKHK